MLKLVIPDRHDCYNETSNRFVSMKGQTILLEHSLVSLSKWESKWHRPFLGKQLPIGDEFIDYIKCMTITKNVPDYIYDLIGYEEIEIIGKYLNDPMTASWFSDNKNMVNNKHGPAITSEIIYFWMLEEGIPFECDKWHLNRLLALIRTCQSKRNGRKMSKNEIYNWNREQNQRRRAMLHSKG